MVPRLFRIPRHELCLVCSRDADDREAQSFDAAIANLFDYPRLFARDLDVLMVESVRCVIEVKSRLDRGEIKDVFEKVSSFKGLRLQTIASKPVGLSVAFAYGCDNINLRFLDFAVTSEKARGDGVSLVCALNQGLFTYWTPQSSSAVREGLSYAHPYLIEASEDTLLIFVYLLVSWLDWNQPPEMAEFWAYAQAAIRNLPSQIFDVDLLDAVCNDPLALERARAAMRGLGNVPFEAAHDKARVAVFG